MIEASRRVIRYCFASGRRRLVTPEGAVRAGVPYLLGGQWPGLEPGYVVMSIEREAQMQNFKGY